MAQGAGDSRPTTGDEELTRALGRARAGDEAAFALVYRCVHPGLLGAVRARVGDDAEDVVSEAWLQIVRDLHRFRGGGADFRRWAATVARHRALDHLRRQRARPRAAAQAEQDMADVPAVDDTAARALEALSTAHVLDLVAALPPEQGRAVLLRVIVGLEGPAAARVLGKRPAAVRSATYRGLRRLAREVPGAAARPDRTEVPSPWARGVELFPATYGRLHLPGGDLAAPHGQLACQPGHLCTLPKLPPLR